MALRLVHRPLKPPIYSPRRILFAAYHDYIRFSNPGGTIRLPLNSPKVIGVANSRGNRSHQEDFYAFASLSLDPEELRLSVKKSFGIDWDPQSIGEPLSRQAVFVGVYDGHGGSAVSQFLRQELHGTFESVTPSMVPELYLWIKELGGYFKRFKGGVLAPWIHTSENQPKFDLEARATTAFLEVNKQLSADKVAQSSGATASVVILHTLDAPAAPFFAADRVALTVAHCGDTRVLLCSTDGAKPLAMTENHHADARIESSRLRRLMSSSMVTDSFGESRWMGALANTRGLGDLRYAKFGVTPEPEVRTKLLEGKEWAFIVLFSDGVSSVLSDDEVVDLARDAPDPKTAANRILSFVEELGGDDNTTAIVVPLAGWGKVTGPDKTRELREYRRQQAVGSERQKRM
ncbi:protein serine/threonine phosphatase 2C [Dendrothele bispora CBS 962.96]|uniref:Protein serine/threonine phosphatase 2C n=1 Tax=Dendrothele bispora (strain CBS 962.96) TaxID=1314807 RepID=A0A4S8MWV8_DENBC|nr:protein serine/threonine phosphatase 2C [Dendrothele bispora CBS 962.96]